MGKRFEPNPDGLDGFQKHPDQQSNTATEAVRNRLTNGATIDDAVNPTDERLAKSGVTIAPATLCARYERRLGGADWDEPS